MYGERISAVLAGFKSKPLDEYRQRSKVIELKIQGEIEPALFEDVADEVSSYAVDVNNRAVKKIEIPIGGIDVELDVEARDGVDTFSRTFERAQLIGMTMAAPTGKAVLGRWLLTVEIERDRDDGIFILDTEKMTADIRLERLASKQGALPLEQPKRRRRPAEEEIGEPNEFDDAAEGS